MHQRWKWAKLQSKAWHEDGTPPEAWSEPEWRGPLPTALAFWAYMIIWQPSSNGHGVIVPSRSRLGRASTIVAILVGIGVVVGTFRRAPWLGLGLGGVAFPIGVAWLAHTIGTWRLPAKCTYLANFLRRPDSPKGSALPLFEAMCVNADHDGRTLALHTRRPRLVALSPRRGRGKRAERPRALVGARADPSPGNPPPRWVRALLS